jgi:hypothetical protein
MQNEFNLAAFMRHTLSPNKKILLHINEINKDPYCQSAKNSVKKFRRTFTEIQQEKQKQKLENKDLTETINLIFNQYIEEIISEKTQWQENFKLLLDEGLVDMTEIVPKSLNSKGAFLLENSKFWFLYFQLKRTVSDNISLTQLIEYFNTSLNYEQTDIRLIYNLFIEVVREYPIEEIILKLPAEMNISIESFTDYHYKYILDKCHLLLMLDVEAPREAKTYTVDIYEPVESKRKLSNENKRNTINSINNSELFIKARDTTAEDYVSNNAQELITILIQRNKDSLESETNSLCLNGQEVEYIELECEFTGGFSYVKNQPIVEVNNTSFSQELYSHDKSRGKVTNVFLKKFQTDIKKTEIAVNRSISFSFHQNFTFSERSPIGLTDEDESYYVAGVRPGNIFLDELIQSNNKPGLVYHNTQFPVIAETQFNIRPNEITENILPKQNPKNDVSIPISPMRKVILQEEIKLEDNTNIDDLMNNTFNLNSVEKPVDKKVKVESPQIMNNSVFYQNHQIDEIPTTIKKNISESTSPRLSLANNIIENKMTESQKKDVGVQVDFLEEQKTTMNNKARNKSVNNKSRKTKSRNSNNNQSFSYSADISENDEDYVLYSKKLKEKRRTTTNKK